MENYLYTCQYCGREYKPNRRKKQKYCSNSCRTRAYQLRNPKLGTTVPTVEKTPESVKIDKMSLAGVGNAAAGALAVQALTNLLTSEENKHATKKDIRNLELKTTRRYYPMIGEPKNALGKQAYFDTLHLIKVYF
jgi:hypothetical protein